MSLPVWIRRCAGSPTERDQSGGSWGELAAAIHQDYAELLRRMGRTAEAAEHEAQAASIRARTGEERS